MYLRANGHKLKDSGQDCNNLSFPWHPIQNRCMFWTYVVIVMLEAFLESLYFICILPAVVMLHLQGIIKSSLQLMFHFGVDSPHLFQVQSTEFNHFDFRHLSHLVVVCWVVRFYDREAFQFFQIVDVEKPVLRIFIHVVDGWTSRRFCYSSRILICSGILTLWNLCCVHCFFSICCSKHFMMFSARTWWQLVS